MGIQAVEDKIVQMGVTRILVAIYEEDFLELSYGFRPNRSCHDSLDRIDNIIMKKPVNHVIEEDMQFRTPEKEARRQRRLTFLV